MLGSRIAILLCVAFGWVLMVSGYAFDGSDSRIIGGANVTGNSSLYLVSIRLAGKDFHCNGALISSREVLTAAQCVYNGNTLRNISEFQLVLGTLTNSNSTNGTTVRSVWNVWPHTGYNSTTRANDLAILRLNQAVSVKTINVGDASPAVNRTCTLFGWGANSTNGKPVGTLQSINLQVQLNSSNHCVKAAGNTPLKDGMLCAGDLQAGRGACTGDLGAPLVCGDRLSGILSLTGGCGGANETSIFIDTAQYTNWITNMTKQPVKPPNTDNGPGTGAHNVVQVSLLLLSVVCTLVMTKK
ncbi:trypsin eta-like [Malaya genurostris]|uniref:trypsin eta-like n=1 Tax=Malaya genurostris TaxID=325434 RepID=UPI0026F3B863|nr:trypsin eta-like [Malaya genurostris]XP_058444412.1 trypsin eta-like [Malaya genurostris]